MFNYHGGEKVKRGLYWNPKKWDMAALPKEGGVLPGAEGNRYIKIPTLLFVLIAPLMGLLYVIFLPFIGFAVVLGLLATTALRAFRRYAGTALLRLMRLAESKER